MATCKLTRLTGNPLPKGAPVTLHRASGPESLSSHSFSSQFPRSMSASGSSSPTTVAGGFRVNSDSLCPRRRAAVFVRCRRRFVSQLGIVHSISTIG